MQLSDEEAVRGVVTHSSGNHAQAVALAARLRGIPAYVVMPHDAPHVKKTAVIGYGAKIIDCEPTTASREVRAAATARSTPPLNCVVSPARDLGNGGKSAN